MDFQSYAVRQHWLKKTEYLTLNWTSMKSTFGATKDEFLVPSLSDIEPDEFRHVRPYPFGDVLRNSEVLPKVLKRANVSSFEELVGLWQQWHVDQIQPISDFCLCPHSNRCFGHKLWEAEMEKRLCAKWIAEHVVHDSDHVIIPEGTSTFWVALAVLARRSDLVLITSHGGVVRELNENPKLRQRAYGVTVVGGEMDVDVGGVGRGFVGEATREGFDAAMTQKPGATVVVSSANGLLPDDGPFAPCPVSGFTRYSLLRKAFESNVRRVVFVADHFKMRPNLKKEYGDAIFADKREWRSILKDNLDRIVIVVTPPAEIRNDSAVMATRPIERVIHGKGYSPPVVEYLMTAAKFDDICSTSNGQSRFFESGVSSKTRELTAL